jgi:ABC-2 type transport system ATP-binding protein
MNAVREYCDRAVLIEDSKVVKIGKSSTIASMYTKMFINQANDEVAEESKDDRWGDGTVRMSNIEFGKKRYSDDDEYVTFSYDVTASQDVEDPVFGFLIKTTAQQPLLGTNSQILQLPKKPMKKGERVTISWKIPNIFNTGTLLLDPSVIYKNGSETADWWEEAAIFDVFKEMKTPYIVNPNMSVSLDESK